MTTITLYLYFGMVTFAHIESVKFPDLPFVVKRPFGRIEGTETTSFIDLLKGDFYFDKTIILKEILKPHKHKNTLITLPSKWGKSLNLDMMKTFFEIQVDEYGNRITPLERSTNYRLFQKNELVLQERTHKLEAPLQISFLETLVKQYQGKHPVILLDFGHMNGSNYKEVIEQVGQRIKAAFLRHNYMTIVLNEELKSATDIRVKNHTAQKIEAFLKVIDEQANYEDLIKSLELLSEILYEHFNSRVFIMIDNYEGVLLNALIHEAITDTEFPLILAFFSSLMVHSFQTNTYLEKSIMTGTFRMLDLIPHLTDVKEYKAINHAMMKLYSIAHEDLIALFNHLNVTMDQQTKFINWYGGYRGGPFFSYTIYSPQPIADFISSKKLGYYETRHAMFDPIFENTFQYRKMRIYILWLIYGKLFLISNRQSGRRQSIVDFLDFKKALHNSKNPFDDLYIESYLCASGTLTRTRILGSFGTKARIPSNAVRMEVADKLMNFYKTKFRISSWALTRAVKNVGSFISNEATNLHNFTIFLESLTKNKLLMEDINKSASEEKEIYELFISFIFNYISFRITLQYDFQIESIEHIQPDNWILFSNKCAVFIQVRVNATSSEHVLNITKNHATTFPNFTSLDSQKFIGINFRFDDNVQISTESHNGPFVMASDYTTKSPPIFV